MPARVVGSTHLPKVGCGYTFLLHLTEPRLTLCFIWSTFILLLCSHMADFSLTNSTQLCAGILFSCIRVVLQHPELS